MKPFSSLHALLADKAYMLRKHSLIMTTTAGSGHLTSCLSSADLVAALFFYAMRYDIHSLDNPANDRFVLSKGHAAPLLYAAWKEAGALSEEELYTYRSFTSSLEGHPTFRFEYAQGATGSLGMGLSIGTGITLASRIDNSPAYTYVLLGDSEVTEGSIWEAAEIASFYHLSSLVGIIDCNGLGQSTETIHGHHTQRYADKFHAFGWNPIIIDGHDLNQIVHALDRARSSTNRPTIIIAKTIKGYGLSVVENKVEFHGKAFKKEELPILLEQLRSRFSEAASLSYPSFIPPAPSFYSLSSQERVPPTPIKPINYSLGTTIATRKAYGQALTAQATLHEEIVALDAEVKNSTFAYLMEEKFPDRFIQCFVAEQNMISMAVGMHRLGKIPFVSTFGAFFTRAFDQIRMAALSNAALRLVGSHAGVSIGQDGPSQMALEDISMINTIFNSVILYPCDGQSTQRLVECMVNYNQGISYLRTSRMETSVIYNDSVEFKIGGSHILQQSNNDIACIVAVGITVYEALKAYTLLKKEGIYVSVIDVYSVKPLDIPTLLSTAQKSGNYLLTVEDHYYEGGLGWSIQYALRNQGIFIECLAVGKLPRSGTSDQLLAYEEINAEAIIKKIKAHVSHQKVIND